MSLQYFPARPREDLECREPPVVNHSLVMAAQNWVIAEEGEAGEAREAMAELARVHCLQETRQIRKCGIFTTKLIDSDACSSVRSNDFDSCEVHLLLFFIMFWLSVLWLLMLC